MRQISARICSLAGLLLILLVILICVPLAVPGLLGYEAYGIVSGSMEPSIPVGSIVYAKSVLPEDVAEGDVIVFYGGAEGDTVTTHRVAENHIPDREFITRGDANDGDDMLPRPYESLIGRVEYSVPYLGSLLAVTSSRQGKLCLLGVLLAAVLLRIVGRRIAAE